MHRAYGLALGFADFGFKREGCSRSIPAETSMGTQTPRTLGLHGGYRVLYWGYIGTMENKMETTIQGFKA